MEIKRIVIVNHVAQLGGAERVLMNMLEHLDQEKYKAELIFLEEGPLVDQAEDLGFSVHVHRSGRLRDPLDFIRTVNAIRRIIRSSEAQLVVSWAPKPQMYGGTAAMLEKVPAVWWQHGLPTGNLFDKLVCRIPTRTILCPSEVVSKAQKKVSPKTNIVVQHPGILMDEFRFDENIRETTRRQFGVSDSATVFAFIGRLQRWKRADIVIQAFQEALRGKDAYLFIVGGALFGVDTEVEHELKRLVHENGLDGQVIFTGHQSRIEPFLWASDAVVHSSLFEPFGMVIVEAMASGRIVLAVNRGGPAEIIRDGYDGLLYDGSVRQLSDLMRRVSEEKFEGLGAAAIRTVRERFAAGVMTKHLQQFLSSAIVR